MAENAPSSAARTAAPRRRRWWLAGTAALLLAAVLGSLALGRWLLGTEAGLRWLLAMAPGVSATGVQGSLLGGSLRVEQLRVRWSGDQAGVELQGLAAEGLRWQWRPQPAAPGTWLKLHISKLQARALLLQSGPASGEPLALPASFRLPLLLRVDELQLQRLQIDELEALQQLQASGLRLDDNLPGAAYELQQLQAQWHGLQLQGRASIAHEAPFASSAQVFVHPLAEGEAPPWAAALRAQGPLETLALNLQLRGVPRGERAAPLLDLSAQLRPLQAWPLGELQASTEALDLSALHPAAPQTRLQGQATLRTRAADAPVSAQLQLENTLPGRWNEGRLPLRRLRADIAGDLSRRDQIELPRFEIELADAMRGAGRLSGQARWQGHQLSLQTALQDLAPQRLDGRAPAMVLAGPLSLQLAGLPSPEPAAAGAPPPWNAALQLSLNGLVEGAPKAVALRLRAEADAHRVELLEVTARTGEASAESSASLKRRDAGSPWQLATRGRLDSFDPLPWLPAAAGLQTEAWRRGPHRLTGQWQFDLRLPAAAERLAPLALLQRLAGNGRLQLQDSLLAGLPLQAELALGYAPGAGTFSGELQLADARMQLQARGNPTGTGENDLWQAELQAPALAQLAPLARLFASTAEWAPSSGSAQLQLAANGRWPKISTEGHAQVQQLRAGRLTLAEGRFDWTLDLARSLQQPLALTLDVSGAQLGAQRAEQLRGSVLGTPAAHRIDIEGLLPVLPPAAASKVLGLAMPRPASAARTGTRLQAAARGAFTATAGGGRRWAADIERLEAGGWDGQVQPAPQPRAATPAAAAMPGPTWIAARQLRAELDFDAAGSLTALRADAGSVRLAETARAHWDAVDIDLRQQPARIELRAELEPFPAAPLLARLQPDMGWTGDLQIGARVQLRAAETFEADIQLERSQGDLAAGGRGSTPGSPRGVSMGLTELRLALRAREGLWNFQADAAGARLGELRGSAQVRSTPQARWPEAEAALQGELQLRVADIGIWNAWVPPPWRVAGSLQGNARLSGRFGAPLYTGQIEGSRLALRNLLQGVNINEGEVRIRLGGEQAVIEEFAFRGGEGTLSVSGTASFGEQPRAQLQMQAERFRVLGRVDRLLVASGQASAELQRDSLRLEGRITADEGLFDISAGDAPSLDSDVNVRGPDTPAASESEAESGFPRRATRVNLVLDLGEKLRLRGRGLDTGLRGQILLTSPNNRLAGTGTIRTVDGTYVGYGQKMDIERGLVAFSGALDNPRLDVLALRPNVDVRVGVAITGALDAYRVRLFSDPEMSENAKLSWLLLGREPDGLGRADTALLQRAAVALLSGEGEAPTDALLRNLGIDELSLRQGDGDERETVITLGKQLSRRWYLGYERGVNATTGTWQLIYRIAQRFTLRAQSGLENSLDVIWVWRPGEALSPLATPQPSPGPERPAVRKSISTPP